MKITIIVTDNKTNQVIYEKEYKIKDKNEIILLSKQIYAELKSLEQEYEYPTYQISQILFWSDDNHNLNDKVIQ